MWRIRARLATVSAVFGQRIKAALRLIYGLSHAWLLSFSSLLFCSLPTFFFFRLHSGWARLCSKFLYTQTSRRTGDACILPLPPPPPLWMIVPPAVLGLFMTAFYQFTLLFSSHLIISSNLIRAFREGEARYVPLGFKAQPQREQAHTTFYTNWHHLPLAHPGPPPPRLHSSHSLLSCYLLHQRWADFNDK